MKKNSYLIEQAKAIEKLRKLTQRNVPEIYACFAKVLIDNGNSVDDVCELFKQTQTLWNELVEHEEIDGMVAWCEQTTGISLATRD